MFDDPKKELELLQEQLLKDEEWFARELDSAKRLIGQMPEKKSVRKPQEAKAAPEQVSQEPKKKKKAESGKKTEEPKKKGVKGLLILMLLELLGIAGLAAYWVLMLL